MSAETIYEDIYEELATQVFGRPEIDPGLSPEEIALEHSVALEIAKRHCNIDLGDEDEYNPYGPNYTSHRWLSARFTYNNVPLRLAIDWIPRFLSDGPCREEDFVEVVRILHVEDDGEGEETHRRVGHIRDDSVGTPLKTSGRHKLNDVMNCITAADRSLTAKQQKKQPWLLKRAGATVLRHLRS